MQMAASKFDGYVERAKLAKRIDRTERTLYRWEREKIGPPVTRVGRIILYRETAIEEWLKKHERK
jgi:DNA-binding XRE family transcriptional regulator